MSMKTISIIMLGFLMLGFVSAEISDCNIKVSLLNQDPIPAIPGDYVDIVFQVSGLEKSECSGAMFEINPSYPFSLDEDAVIDSISGSTWASSEYKTYWTLPYTLRIASDALDGAHELNVKYGENDLSLSKSFNISIQDSRTDFDAVIQEYSSEEVSIAIANIGKYTANSVVVRVPQQDNFVATGTDGQMVGSLDSGDYTIVNFAISRVMQRESENSNVFAFDIYYTDALGERRVVNMELPLNLGSSSSNITRSFSGNEIPNDFYGMNREQKSFFSSIYVKGAVVFIFLIGIVVLYRKYPKEVRKIKDKIKSKFHKEKKALESKEIPDWIKNIEDKDVKKMKRG